MLEPIYSVTFSDIKKYKNIRTNPKKILERNVSIKIELASSSWFLLGSMMAVSYFRVIALEQIE